MGKIFSLTSDEAEKILTAAIQILKSQSQSASVVIVNRDETEIAKAIMDGVKPVTAHVALMKARQAAWVGKSTSVTKDEIMSGEKTPEILGIEPENLVPWAGGVPIYDQEGNHLGGIGVSNLRQEEDDKVANNAILNSGFKTEP